MQSVACLTADLGLPNNFCGDLSRNNFCGHFPPSTYLRREIVSYHDQLHVLAKVCAQSHGPSCSKCRCLTSSLRVISLTVLADSLYNIPIFFAEKM